MRHEVRFSGFGGQGIILSAVILGRAAALHDGKHAVQTQVYGPEARGGASKSEVILSDEAIRRTVAQFWERLAPGGSLFLGHAESLSRITDRFTPLRFPGAMVYQRPPGGAS